MAKCMSSCLHPTGLTDTATRTFCCTSLRTGCICWVCYARRLYLSLEIAYYEAEIFIRSAYRAELELEHAGRRKDVSTTCGVCQAWLVERISTTRWVNWNRLSSRSNTVDKIRRITGKLLKDSTWKTSSTVGLPSLPEALTCLKKVTLFLPLKLIQVKTFSCTRKLF